METTEAKAAAVEETEEEITEFETGQPHPDTPQSVLEEFGFETRDYDGDADDTAFDDTWKKLEKRRAEKKKWKTLVIPDPEAEGEVLTFRYREIDPGSSVLTDDIAIITGVIYNTKHERANDTMVKAVEEGRLEEYLQVQKNNREWQNKVMSLGLQIPIEQVEETITHPIVRARLVYAIRGGAVPRLDTDAQTDVDTFPEPVEGQEPTETASESGGT